MGAVLGKVFPQWGTKRLVRFQDCTRSRLCTTMATGVENFKEIARQKLGYRNEDTLEIRDPGGFEVEDDDVFFQLEPQTALNVVNVSRGQTWDPSPEPPEQCFKWLFGQSHPQSIRSPDHQVTRDASGTSTVTYIITVNNIQAQQAQVGDGNQALMSGVPVKDPSGGSPGSTRDEDRKT